MQGYLRNGNTRWIKIEKDVTIPNNVNFLGRWGNIKVIQNIVQQPWVINILSKFSSHIK